MIIQFLIGAVLILTTVIFHAFSCDFIIKKIKYITPCPLRELKSIWKALILSVVVFDVSCIIIIEIWIWALTYLWIGALTGLEEALYFSISSFTTVGFGDVVLGKDWRILSSIEATNGFILFGWSTAFIFEIVSQVYHKNIN